MQFTLFCLLLLCFFSINVIHLLISFFCKTIVNRNSTIDVYGNNKGEIITMACNVNDVRTFSSTEQDLQQEKEFSVLAKALSHPARVRILRILSALEKAEGCLNSDLVSELGLAQSTVSEHLRILKLAGFITAESIPPKMCYRINRDCIHQFESLTHIILD